ncbi:hypothetical protein TNCT_144721 [Trichonephila clavata]|uniref:ISXO2-like transposase domain-containing protein n=1 Tax=Trichonephila clavata TaxID=2740835 RepID=A0A8X6F3X4_TRICU|nr:hypothetical protein TNCT_144721 [Trichonephila clavata]
MRRCFLVAVHDWTAETFLGLIESRTTVISDCWESYERLSERSYNQFIEGSNLLILRPAHIQKLSKLLGVTSKLPCLNTIEKEDLKDMSPGTCSGKFVSF